MISTGVKTNTFSLLMSKIFGLTWNWEKHQFQTGNSISVTWMLVALSIFLSGFMLFPEQQHFNYLALGVGVLNPKPLEYTPGGRYNINNVDFIIINSSQVTDFLKKDFQYDSRCDYPTHNATEVLVFLKIFLITFGFFNMLLFNLRLFTWGFLDQDSFLLYYVFFFTYYIFYVHTRLNIYFYFKFLTSFWFTKLLGHFLKLYDLGPYTVLLPIFWLSLSSIFFYIWTAVSVTELTFLNVVSLILFYFLFNYSSLYVILFWKLFLPLIALFDDSLIIKKLPLELKWLMFPQLLFPTGGKGALAEAVVDKVSSMVQQSLNQMPPQRYNNLVKGGLILGTSLALGTTAVVGYNYVETQKTVRALNRQQTDYFLAKTRRVDAQTEVYLAQAREIDAKTNTQEARGTTLANGQRVKVFPSNPFFSKIKDVVNKK